MNRQSSEDGFLFWDEVLEYWASADIEQLLRLSEQPAEDEDRNRESRFIISLLIADHFAQTGDMPAAQQRLEVIRVTYPEFDAEVDALVQIRIHQSKASIHLLVSEYARAAEELAMLSFPPFFDRVSDNRNRTALVLCRTFRSDYLAAVPDRDAWISVLMTKEGAVIRPEWRFGLLVALGDHYKAAKNLLKAGHCYSLAAESCQNDAVCLAEAADSLISIDKGAQVIELVIENLIKRANLPDKESDTLLSMVAQAQRIAKPIAEHGHRLFQQSIKENILNIRKMANRPLTLIEIGSTRELTSEQGSTAKLAHFCKGYNIHFITVDMDPINTTAAAHSLAEIDAKFEAICRPGEDFLQEYDRPIDFIFLDAYDFDHGKHSEERQARYEKILGDRISDHACHEMHLKCAQQLVDKLAPWGIIGFDDVWYKDDRWHGKGTTAMPFLLEKGFVVTASDRQAAVLMRVD